MRCPSHDANKNKADPDGVAVVLLVLGAVVFVTFTREKEIRRPVESSYAVEDAQFQRSMSFLLGPALVPGNRVDTLLNGNRIFPSMLEAIRSARRTINFETYIYWSGDVGKAFADALSERARAGVKVRILVDWVGSQRLDEAMLKQMTDAGAEIHKYHPPRWYNINRLNNRTHRKILVVDGQVGFTGGVGIADEWSGDARTRTTGATPTIASRGRRSRRCRPRSQTTGSR
jgi:cardiolipin synthase